MSHVPKNIKANVLNHFKQTDDNQEQNTEQDGERNGDYFFHQLNSLVNIKHKADQENQRTSSKT